MSTLPITYLPLRDGVAHSVTYVSQEIKNKDRIIPIISFLTKFIWKVFINMILDVNSIIRILSDTSKQGKFEFTEQEGETSTPPSGGGSGSASSGGGTPPSYPQVSKWESGRTMGKTYGGPGYKWESGRTMGKTYGGSNYKWFTGLKRGKANQAKES
jgi:hypothetical protein